MRLSDRGLKVLATFLEDPKRALAGADLYRATGVGAGTIYPMLIRFERAGWMTAEWEEIDPVVAGRPAKRMFRLTNQGLAEAYKRFSELQPKGEMQWAT